MAGKTTKDEQPKDAAPQSEAVEEELSPAAEAERSLPQAPDETELPERFAYEDNSKS